jgi:hypothetical protein
MKLKSDQIRVQIEATQPLEDPTPTISTFTTRDYLDHESLCTMFPTLMLSRVVYLILAEQNTLSIRTLEHFLVIFLPVSISIFQFHQTPKWNGPIGSILLYISLILFFGLGWNIPATFNSQRDTLANYLFFLCFLRVHFSMVQLHQAYLNKSVDETFIQSCLAIAPILPWFVCFLQSNGQSFYVAYWVGVCTDIVAYLGMDIAEIKYQKIKLKKGPIQNGMKCLFAISMCFLFEIRLFAEYPQNISGVPFQILNFVIGCVGLLCLYSMYLMYMCLIGKVETVQGKGLIVYKWGHMILQGTVLITASALHMISMNTFYPPSVQIGLPLNLTIPQKDLFRADLVVNTTGIDYLGYLKLVYGEVSNPVVWSGYFALLTIGLGSYVTSISVLEWLSPKMNILDRTLRFIMFITGIVSITVGSLISWSSASLTVPLSVVTAVTSILVLAQLVSYTQGCLFPMFKVLK